MTDDVAEERAVVATNHAILRYQERIERLPMEEVRGILEADELRDAVARGCQYYTLEGGHRAIIAGRRIVTVLEAGMRPKKSRPKRTRRPSPVGERL